MSYESWRKNQVLELNKGICVPNSCNTDDVNSIAENLYGIFLKIILGIRNTNLVFDLIRFGYNYPTLAENIADIKNQLVAYQEPDVKMDVFKCHEHVNGKFIIWILGESKRKSLKPIQQNKAWTEA